jgi:hypothetical protein
MSRTFLAIFNLFANLAQDVHWDVVPDILGIQRYQRAGQTQLRMTLLLPSKEARDGALASSMAHGVAAGYDRRDEILSGLL